MTFTKGNVDSVLGIKNILYLFYSFSGLSVNVEKTEFFCSGVFEGAVRVIVEESGFQIGKLPVRNLGVPLVTRNLSLADCEPLLKKLRDKVEGWSSKLLSYAGRLQLVQAVLFSIQVYWSRHFILPKRVIKEIDKICSAFF